MVNNVANELSRIVEYWTVKFKKIDPNLAREKPLPAKWSIQEILGHLIDSAANNHQRFVRAQEVEALVFPWYDQDAWVRTQGYNKREWLDLVELWRLYNLHLAQVIKLIPEEKLVIKCMTGPHDSVTLQQIVEGYVDHLKHHLEQIETKSAV